MKLLRLLGRLWLAAGVISSGFAIVTTLTRPVGGLMTLFAEQWGKFNSGGLKLVQEIVQRYIHSALWAIVLVDILLSPGWLLFGAIGFLFYLFGGQREIKGNEI